MTNTTTVGPKKASESEKEDANKPWSESIGRRPHSVVAYERLERGGTIWVRYTLPGDSRRDKRTKRPLHLALGEKKEYTVRKEPTLQRVAKGVKSEVGETPAFDSIKKFKAAEATKRLFYQLQAGADPGAPAKRSEPTKRAITLSEGFEMAFADFGGMHVSIGRHKDDLRRAARDIVQHLGERTLWKDINAGMLTGLLQKLADANTVHAAGGPRWAEVVLGLVYAVSTWLSKQKQISRDEVVEPEKKWRKVLRKNWEKRTGKKVTVKRLRHTHDELLAMWNTLDSPFARVDPRIRLLMLIAAEMRAGQGLHVMRTNLTLDATELAPFGQVLIPGDGNKEGGIVNLSRRDREMVDAMLDDGHLSRFEKLFRRGIIRDYPLFPGGKLLKGKCNPDQTRGSMDRRTALEQFHALEHAARIVPVQGRAWYGIRRKSADIAETLTTDDRVKDVLGGWKEGSETRTRVYLEDQTEIHRAGASRIREEIRGQRESDGKAT